MNSFDTVAGVINIITPPPHFLFVSLFYCNLTVCSFNKYQIFTWRNQLCLSLIIDNCVSLCEVCKCIVADDLVLSMERPDPVDNNQTPGFGAQKITGFTTVQTRKSTRYRKMAVPSWLVSLKLVKERFNKDVMKYSFSNRVINVWNRLPENVVNCTSINSFKTNVDKIIRKMGDIYELNSFPVNSNSLKKVISSFCWYSVHSVHSVH